MALPAFAFETETDTLIAAMTAAGSTPNSRRQYTLNRMIKRLKANSLFSKLTGLWVIGDTAATSLINIVNPGTKNLVSNGSPAFTANVGWAFPLITDFLDTQIPLSTTSTNDIALGYFGKIASASSNDMGVQATGGAVYMKNNTVAAALNGANSSPLGASSNWWDGVGMVALSRTSSTGFQGYHCGIAVTATTDVAVPPTSTLPITIGKVNGQTTQCKRTIQAAFVGAGLTSSEMEQLHAIVQTAIDSIEYGDLDIKESGFQPTAPTKVDLVVYGTTLAGVAAAYRAAQLGRSVILVGGWRDRTLGGMSGNGLGLVDYDTAGGIGGFAFDAVAAARTINGQSVSHTGGVANLQFNPQSMKLALAGKLDGARSGGYSVPVYWSDGVASVVKTGTTITSMTTVDGRTFSADYFIDTSEEMDLSFCAGVTTIIGREAQNLANFERLNGYRGTDRTSGSNDVQIENGSSVRLPIANAYNTPGDSASGLIYGISAQPSKTVGQADDSSMSYTFRQNWNTNQARRVPFGNIAPPSYLASNYELLARYFNFYPTATFASIIKASLLFNTVTDTNNTGGISYNLVGSGNDYLACESAGTRAQVYAAREVVQKNIENWVRGFTHFILNSGDSRIPSAVLSSMQSYGWDTRHHLDPHPNDSLYWPPRLYVRQHRRLVSDFIMNATDVTKSDATAPRSAKIISTISYRFDSHPHMRFPDTVSGTVFCEGSLNIAQVSGGGSANGTDQITPVPFEAYVPKPTEATNLAVTFGLSCTHVVMCAARMELTTAQAGESLAYAVNQAIANGKQPIQNITYSDLRTSILAAPTLYPPNLQQDGGVVVDDTTPNAFTFVDVTGAALSTLIESNTITVAGIDGPSAISVTGGQYAVDAGSGFGAWTSTSATVVAGNQVKVRNTSSASSSTAVNTVLTIGGVSDTYTITTAASGDTTPDAFSFTSVTGKEVSTATNSNTITIAGIDTPTTISVSNGMYSKNGAAYTSATGSVVAGDTVAAQVTTSSSYSTAATVTITIGGVNGTFTATTRAADTVPNAFSFATDSNAPLSTVRTSNTITLSGMDAGQPSNITISAGGTYSKNGGSYTASAGTAVNGDTLSVRITSSAAYSSSVSATVTVGGVSGSFTVTTLADPLAPVVTNKQKKRRYRTMLYTTYYKNSFK